MTDQTDKKTYLGNVRIELGETWSTSHVYINDVEVGVTSLDIHIDGSSKDFRNYTTVKLGLYLDVLKFALQNASIEVSEQDSDNFGKMFELLVTPSDKKDL